MDYAYGTVDQILVLTELRCLHDRYNASNWNNIWSFPHWWVLEAPNTGLRYDYNSADYLSFPDQVWTGPLSDDDYNSDEVNEWPVWMDGDAFEK